MAGTIPSFRLKEVIFWDHPHHDTCWAITKGADKKIYVGVCCEYTGGQSACLYVYDPVVQQARFLFDLAEVTGEDNRSGYATQGKIHFSLCPAQSGEIYGATHCTTPPYQEKIWNPYTMWGNSLRKFPGAHLWCYHPTTGKVEDFGIIFPYQGIPLLILEEKEKRLYGVTYPLAHFFSCNLQGRDLQDYGRISIFYPLSIFKDKAGNIYIPTSTGKIIQFNRQKKRLLDTKARIPPPPWSWSDHRKVWPCDAITTPSDQAYLVPYSYAGLFRFDLSTFKITELDLGLKNLNKWQSAVKALALDKKGRLYYTILTPKTTFLLCRNLKTDRIEVLGELLIDGYPTRQWRAVAGEKGEIYFARVDAKPTSLIIYYP